MRKKIISSAILLLTAIIWGFAFVAQVIGMESVGTFTFNGIRYIIGVVVLLPLCLIVGRKLKDKRIFRDTFIFGSVAGLIMFAATTLQQYGIELDSGGNSMKAGFITGLYTVAVPICEFIVFKKKTGAMTWIGAVIATGGLYLLCVGDGFGFSVSDILLFISVPLWTAHIMLVDKIGERINPYIFSATQYFVCGAIALICALIFDRGSLNADAVGSALLPILYGGVMSVGVAYTLQIVGQRHADPTVAAIILSCESMFCALGNLLILSVDMSAKQYIGCALMFLGIIVSQLYFGKKKERSSNDGKTGV